MTRTFQLIAVALCLAGSADTARAHGWSFGFNFGGPAYRPYYAPAYYYRPYYYAPPPVIYRPAPVIIEEQPAIMTVPAQTTVPVTRAPVLVQANHEGSASRIEICLQELNDVREVTRRGAAIELGRMRTERAVDPLVGLLNSDASPTVRDAAARGLGLIGSPRSLNALIHAAQADQDRDVRHSAQFSVEIIRTNLRPN